MTTTGTSRTTADHKPITTGMRVWIWDDLPPIPTLDLYEVQGICSWREVLRLRPVPPTTGQPGRLAYAELDDAWHDQDKAVIAGFGRMVVSLAEEDDWPGNPRNVTRNGIRIDLDGQTLWFGGYSAHLARSQKGKVLVGWPNARRRDRIAVYELDGTYIETAKLSPAKEGAR